MTKRKKILAAILFVVGLIMFLIGYIMDKNGATSTSTALFLFGGLLAIGTIITVIQNYIDVFKDWLSKK